MREEHRTAENMAMDASVYKRDTNCKENPGGSMKRISVLINRAEHHSYS